MRYMKIALLAAVPLLLTFAMLSCSGPRRPADAATVTVTPEETDAILANPGMGWQTFHLTRKEDRNLPSWIPSTVCYFRWSWSEVEPQPGRLDTAMIDLSLRKARECGQKLAFRIKACSPTKGKPFHPAWLAGAGGRVALVDYNGGGPEIPVPDLDDPATLALHLDLVRRLGERYDGHPDIDHIDIGSVGWWGEWHLSRSKLAKMPSRENLMKVVDTYQQAFQRTPLLMLVDGGECTLHATRNGAGWRADSLGDLGSFDPKWNHMHHKYPDLVRDNGLADIWKTAPVAFEPPKNMDEFVIEKRPMRWIFNYGLALHGSYFNGKSSKLPDDPKFRDELKRFLVRLGYRLVITELKHPARVSPGAAMRISSKWRNKGSAPCYRPYRIAYRLTDQSGNARVFPGSATVNHWMPGSVELFTAEFFKHPGDLPPGEEHMVEDVIRLPAAIPPGRHLLSVGIVGEDGLDPVVMLGIAGRDADGWYPLGVIQVAGQ